MKIVEADCKDRIHSLFAEYTETLARVLRESKPVPGSGCATHDRYFGLFAESLCYRDELDAYLTRSGNSGVRSILNTDALDNYQDVFEYLRNPSLSSYTDVVEEDEAMEPRLSVNARKLVTLALRTFGSTGGWDRIQAVYFPALPVQTLRQLYYEGASQAMDHEPAPCPKRWTVEEDYALVTAIETFGRGRHGVHEIFMSLSGTRSVDEIDSRISTIYAKPAKSKRKKRAFESKEPKSISTCPCTPEDVLFMNTESSSDWSIDDNLLEFKSD